MEQKDIDIYEILKGMPKGIELYTPMCGRVDLSWLATNKEAGEAIGTENRNGEFTFNKEGKYLEDGEVLLFPSDEMRDWSKFFKKGDVLEYKGENNCKGTCIFESYEDEMTKLDFTGLYILQKGEIWNNPTSFRTADWVKSDDPAGYIKTVEEQLGGKLNLETLKVEKQEKPSFEEACTQWEKQKEAKEHPVFKPFDKVLVRCDKKYKWLPAFFVRDRGEEYAWRFNALPIHSGHAGDFTSCIPFEGNENIAFTNYDFEDLPF